MIYRILREQTVPVSIEAVWSYFVTPRILNEMMPPDMKFVIINNV